MTQQERCIEGVVESMSTKTIGVRVTRRVKHELGKYVTRSSKFLAHDEAQEAKVGDRVAITECRPVSKQKSWRLHRVIETTGEA